MYIIPEKGYLLVKTHIVEEEQKSILIMPSEKKEVRYEVLKGSEKFPIGTIVIPNPYKNKYQMSKEDAFIIHEDDIIGRLEA